jgi:hypothetical protein
MQQIPLFHIASGSVIFFHFIFLPFCFTSDSRVQATESETLKCVECDNEWGKQVQHDVMILSVEIPVHQSGSEEKENAVPLDRCIASYYSQERLTNEDSLVFVFLKDIYIYGPAIFCTVHSVCTCVVLTVHDVYVYLCTCLFTSAHDVLLEHDLIWCQRDKITKVVSLSWNIGVLVRYRYTAHVLILYTFVLFVVCCAGIVQFVRRSSRS